MIGLSCQRNRIVASHQISTLCQVRLCDDACHANLRRIKCRMQRAVRVGSGTVRMGSGAALDPSVVDAEGVEGGRSRGVATVDED